MKILYNLHTKEKANHNKTRKYIFTAFYLLFISSFVFPNQKNLVLKVSFNQDNLHNFDKEFQSLIEVAHSQFLHDLTLLPEITIRNSDIDNKMREIQKQSQIDASIGLGSETATYSADKGSKADLAISFSINQIDKENYQIICSISEIESMKLLSIENTKLLPIEKITKEEVINEIAYRIILNLEQRGYISSVSDIKISQLHNNIYAKEVFDDTVATNTTESTSELLEIGINAYNNKNYKLAFEYLSKTKNIPESCYYLGHIYYYGYGVSQDYYKAAYYYEMAAKQGLAFAQFALGSLYFLGNGVLQDFEKGVYWFQKSADQDLSFAQYMLAQCYYYGKGVKKNYNQAKYYYQLAASQGDEKAKKALSSQSFQEQSSFSANNSNSYYGKSSSSWNYSSYNNYYDDDARDGLHLDIGYINGSFYHGADISASCTWGGEHFSAGFDTGILLPLLKSEYIANYTGSWIMYYWDFIIGYSISLKKISPYIETGIGAYYNLLVSDISILKIGIQLEEIIGVDFKLSPFTLGFMTKFKYMHGLGFADTYGISCGIDW